MIHFQHPNILYLLILVPIVAGLWVWIEYRKNKKLQEFARVFKDKFLENLRGVLEEFYSYKI